MDTPAEKPAPARRRQKLLWTLVALGVVQNVAWFTGPPAFLKWTRALAMSPNPVVFSSLSGVSNFVGWFDAEFRLEGGIVTKRHGTADAYANLPGPYQRKSIYGGALSYAPHRPEQYFYGILQHGFCGGPLAQSFGVTQSPESVLLTIPVEETGQGTHAKVMMLRCGQ